MNKKLTLPSHKIKIVCTIGPASRSESVLRKLVKGGMNVARLNFAHGSLEEHREDIRRISSVASQLNQLVMILIDLPGPKIRIGKLQDEPVVLKKGASVTLTTNDILGTFSLIPVNYKQLPESVAKGGTIYLNDGFIQLKVLEVSGTEVRCKVAIGGQLLSHKGLNLPNAKILIDPVTDQDLEFVEFGLQEGVETFSVSFVEKADDLIKVKEFARKRGRSINVVAKIERAEAVKNIDEILEVADAIMVARGDLGVQLPVEEVPGVQKKLIHKANLLGRPVITATQMLGSMTENIRPTRAEATDVANAILDGTDAVMLSEETTIGKYPVDTVKMMVRIAMSIEHQRRAVKITSDLEDYFKGSAGQKNLSIEDVVSLNVIEAARALNVRFIVTPTQSGSTPRRISRFKPNCWILSFTDNEKTHNFLGLSYGVYPFEMEKEGESWREGVMKFIKKSGLVNKGDRVILTESVPPGEVEGTNSLSIITVR